MAQKTISDMGGLGSIINSPVRKPNLIMHSEATPSRRPELIPIQAPPEQLPILNVEDFPEQYRQQTKSQLSDLPRVYDYAVGAPIRAGIADQGGLLSAIGAVGKQFLKKPEDAPTWTEIAEQTGLSPKSFKEAAMVAGQSPDQYPDISPAQIGGFVGENVFDPLNLSGAGAAKGIGMGAGLMAGKKAKGFAKAQGKMSGIWDKMERFQIADNKAKIFDEIGREGQLKWLKKNHPKDYKSYIDETNFRRGEHTKEETLKSIDESTRINNKYGLWEDNKLSQTLDHKELYDNYPEFKDTELHFEDFGSETGYFDGKNNKIVLDNSFKKDKKKLKETLIHEVQHKIQRTEGFAKGGGPKEFEQDLGRAKFMAEQSIYKLNDKMNVIYKKSEDIRKAVPDSKWNKNLPEYDQLAKYKKETEDLMDMRSDLIAPAQVDVRGEAYESYRKLAGEAEARDEAFKMNLTAKQRLSQQPLESTGLQVDDLIVRGESGQSMSAIESILKKKQ